LEKAYDRVPRDRHHHHHQFIKKHMSDARTLIKDTSSLMYCLTMFDVCHMFVL